MSIFSIRSLVNCSEGVKSGGCFRRSGSERRGEDGMWWRIQYYSGRVVHTGCTQFATFSYLATAKVPKGVTEDSGCGRGWTKPLGLFSSGDGFRRFDLIKGRPDRWWAWARSSVVLREWRCAIRLAKLACLHGSFDNGFLLSGSEGKMTLFLARVNFDCYSFLDHIWGVTTSIAW